MWISKKISQASDELHPVLVFVHGGGFEIGDVNVYGKQDMANLYASRGILMVLVEYRLGVLGLAIFLGNLHLFVLFTIVSLPVLENIRFKVFHYSEI
jgi:hypothetical protein